MGAQDLNEWATADHARAYLEGAERMPRRDVGYAELLELLLLRPTPPSRVLDLGTGDGRLLSMIGAPGVALDFSPTMLEAADGAPPSGGEVISGLGDRRALQNAVH